MMPRKTGPMSWRPTSNRLTDSGTVPTAMSVVRLAEALDDIRAERPASDINRRCAHSLCGDSPCESRVRNLGEIAGGVVERLFRCASSSRRTIPPRPCDGRRHHDDPTGGNVDEARIDLRPRGPGAVTDPRVDVRAVSARPSRVISRRARRMFPHPWASQPPQGSRPA